ncbi:hypothetical protein [Mycobacterium talmoniae]|uniref:Uncharacterized protein n=1 Tax=Mycobacterium talmoniae TaxID=1858794 RepID=A0A1S1NC65_9MYCO|nr:MULTISPECIES: hypothetical protein [Mycobacterium]OHU97000.1 hypothetical protein BKN37_22475 [Mycobacterium talmoniae]PQM48124.1 hypothetical protein C1Y40_01659 [Mycobacterium talmoniae]TDH48933.1 hypothetical protein E2F47_22060 [Mycobacterium eburneum]
MTRVHPDLGELGPELRKLAQAILDGIDPALRTAAALAAAGDPGKCQQVWCPVCALAAVVSGEQHPLLTVIAEHSTALLAVIRAMVADVDGPRDQPPPPDGPPGGEPTDKSRYQPIPVIVQD